jgi:hypothetical protein
VRVRKQQKSSRLGERCPGITINNIREKADYVVLLDHEGGKDLIRRDNKVVI